MRLDGLKGRADPCPAILVVDDTPPILKLIKILLESEGYIVLIAADGLEGKILFEQNRERIGLVLTDVIMPRMSGFILADHIRALDPTLPILFMSGNARFADRGDGCLAKPFKKSDLIGRVSQALARSRPKAAAHTAG
ncbi:MAG: sensor histidine kinase response regulator [Candidatus Solibacter sp.]|jgi:two-component system cell cycle sensor histidine kinase/response regulator CckA|nr:sensor histidine kinase response regulator [Candidatus Solibacter sp.]